MATLRTYSATVDQLDPLARWRFDEESGTTAVDRADGFDGTYVGAVELGARGGPIGTSISVAGASGSGMQVVVPDGASDPIRLGFLGDSLFANFQLATADAIPAVLVDRLESDGFAIDAEVVSGNGQRADQLRDEAATLADQNLDAVILAIGSNDSLQGRAPAEFELDLRAIIQEFRDAGTEVLVTSTFGLWPDEIFGRAGYDTTDPDNAAALAAEFEQVFDTIAADPDLDVAVFGPLTQPVRDDPDSFNLIVDDEVEPGLVEGPEPDGVHPNEAGVQQIVADLLPSATALVSGVAGGDALALASGSIEMWFVAEQINTRALVAKDAAGDNANDLRAAIGSNGRVVFQIGEDLVESAGGIVTPGRPSHVVMTFGSNGMKLFVDGELVDQNDAVVSLEGNTEPFEVGLFSAEPGPVKPFDGLIDEVAIYSQELTGEQVAALSQGVKIRGTNDADVLIGTEDDEILRGELGADDIQAGGGNDVVRGSRGGDTIAAGGGEDLVRAGVGDDVVFGGPGNDRIRGGRGSDDIDGLEDSDFITAGGGQDTVAGGAGDDTLNGGQGFDQLTGDDGADTFTVGRTSHGVDDILDFTPGEGDVLQLHDVLNFDGGSPADFVRLSETGSDTEVAVDGNGGGDAFQPVFTLIGATGLDLQTLVDDGNISLTPGVA